MNLARDLDRTGCARGRCDAVSLGKRSDDCAGVRRWSRQVVDIVREPPDTSTAKMLERAIRLETRA